MRASLNQPLRWKVYSAVMRRLSSFFRKLPVLTPQLLSGIRGDGSALIWLHGASVGELEALIPVAEVWFQSSPAHRVVLSAFSPSAAPLLKRLQSQWRDLGLNGRFVIGFSPNEGDWLSCLEAIRPHAFLNYRYEAWPDLWASLIRLNIPVWVLAARDRLSLRMILPLVRWMLGERSVPRVVWCPLASEMKPLQNPVGEVQTVRDPRWDRVEQRRLLGSPRVQLLKEKMEALSLPRSWGVMGNVWETDFPVILAALKESQGGLWVVPHRLDPETSESFIRFFTMHGISFLRSSEIQPGLIHALDRPIPLRVVFVDEFGCLAELYGAGEWAYVGGGFGSSIHNLLEPAVHGLPLSCGPKGGHRFPEVEHLKARGQLQVVHDAEGFSMWLNWLTRGAPQKAGFRRSIESEDLGGAQQIVRGLQSRRG